MTGKHRPKQSPELEQQADPAKTKAKVLYLSACIRISLTGLLTTFLCLRVQTAVDMSSVTEAYKM